MRIGLFDSGIGGLTVLKEIKTKYPKNEYIYFGDNKNLPYGSKSKQQLYNLASQAVEFLLTKEVDIIIIACGTVSSNVYDELKNKYNISIYDVITPVINYINNSNFNSVGLLATEATIKSNKFKQSIQRDFKQQSCPLLVPFLEGDNSIDIDSALNEYLMGLNSCDAIILGCTHYPILKDKIKKISHAELINMGTVISDFLNVTDSFECVNLYFSMLDNNLINKINDIIDFDYKIEEV